MATAAPSDQGYLDARAKDVLSVERQIGELSGLFSRLAGVVAEQGAMVERIEDNVAISLDNLEAGTTQLQTWRERVYDNSALGFRIFGTLLTAAVVFAVFGT